MNRHEALQKSFDLQRSAHLAELAHTGDHEELQAEADDYRDLAGIMDRLRILEATPHEAACDVHRVGSTSDPWCSCGRNAAIDDAGGLARR